MEARYTRLRGHKYGGFRRAMPEMCRIHCCAGAKDIFWGLGDENTWEYRGTVHKVLGASTMAGGRAILKRKSINCLYKADEAALGLWVFRILGSTEARYTRLEGTSTVAKQGHARNVPYLLLYKGQ